jgi:3-oxoadipate enol-lactonase
VELMMPVSGGEIWAQDTGGDGTPVVLVNAGWATAEIWSPLIGLLDGRYRVIRYDDRGYGRSPAPSVPFTRLADLRAVLDHTGIAAAVVVGHSGGGGTALGLALSEPERVASLILIAPGAPDYPWPEDDPYLGEFFRLFAAGDREGLVSLGLKTWAAAGDDAAAVAEISAAVAGSFTVGELERPDPPAYQRLSEVRAPAVMIRGDLEYPMVAESADRIASRIPGCRRVVVAGADHLLPLRAPGRLAEIISGLTGLAGGPAGHAGHPAGRIRDRPARSAQDLREPCRRR